MSKSARSLVRHFTARSSLTPQAPETTSKATATPALLSAIGYPAGHACMPESSDVLHVRLGFRPDRPWAPLPNVGNLADRLPGRRSYRREGSSAGPGSGPKPRAGLPGTPLPNLISNPIFPSPTFRFSSIPDHGRRCARRHGAGGWSGHAWACAGQTLAQAPFKNAAMIPRPTGPDFSG